VQLAYKARLAFRARPELLDRQDHLVILELSVPQVYRVRLVSKDRPVLSVIPVQ
jgi:hypothetical protein